MVVATKQLQLSVHGMYGIIYTFLYENQHLVTEVVNDVLVGIKSVSVCVYVYVSMCLCLCMCMSVYVYVHVHVHVHACM